MDSSLKQRILSNPFATRLLGFTIDRDAFKSLCESLRELSVAWKPAKEVDKEIVQDLYTTAMIMRNKVRDLRESGEHALADELEEMFLELDRLFNEQCLSDKD